MILAGLVVDHLDEFRLLIKWYIVGVCECVGWILTQMSSSRNSYFFSNAASLEIYLRREFIHALLITHTVMLDQCCVHVNKAVHFCVSTEL